MLESVGWIDWVVLALAGLSALAVGFWFRGSSGSADSFLFGGRCLPWWAILGSIVATETSAVTVLSVTGVGFGAVGFGFLQLALGLCCGKLVVAVFLMPLFFSGRMVSAYEILQNRFGMGTRRAAGLMFLVARNLGDGLRLCLGALVFQQLLGWPFALCVAVTGLLTVVYTCLGGMRSVVWNDCIQLLVYLTGAVATLWVLAAGWPGGWSGLAAAVSATGKLRVFDFGFDPAVAHQFWAGLIGGTFLAMGTHGVDQMMVQRYLSTRSRGEASLALALSGVVVAAQFALFLLIGIALGCYYAGRADGPVDADGVYLHFIVSGFPSNSGLAGLMLAAILAATMSTLSSSLNASASSLLNDFVLPGLAAPPSPVETLGLTRGMTAGFGLLQVGIGIWAGSWGDSVIHSALTIAGFAFGILLGLFGLALLVRPAGSAAALGGAAVGLVALVLVQWVLPQWGLKTAYPWLALTGSACTLAGGMVFAAIRPQPTEGRA